MKHVYHAGTVQSATPVQLQHCLKQETMMEYQNIFVNIQKNFTRIVKEGARIC